MPIEKLLENSRRYIVFRVSYITFTKKTQGISSNLFVIGRKFSNFVPTVSRALRNFPTFLALDFPQLSDAQRQRLKFHINVRQGLKKLLNGLLDLSCCWIIISSIFRSSNTSFLGCDYCIWNRLELLKTMLLPFPKNDRYTNILFSYLSKMGEFATLWMDIQNSEVRM